MALVRGGTTGRPNRASYPGQRKGVGKVGNEKKKDIS